MKVSALNMLDTSQLAVLILIGSYVGRSLPSNMMLGLVRECVAYYWLRSLGVPLEISNFMQNTVNDIDWFVNGVGISFKWNRPSEFLAFELSVQYQEGTSKDSWFYTGKAEWYIIQQGQLFYLIHKNTLVQSTNHHGFDDIRSLNYATRAKQGVHSHKNARLGLLKPSTLKTRNLISLIFSEAIPNECVRVLSDVLSKGNNI